jgi:putative thioredoxin
MVSEFMGAQPEGRVREFLSSIIPDENALLLEKGLMLLNSGQVHDAEVQFRNILSTSPTNPPALLGLSRSLLRQGLGEEGYRILKEFPPSREYSAAEKLHTLAEELLNIDAYTNEDDPLEAAYQNSLRLVKRGNYEAAMDGLLDILRQNKRYKDGKAHKLILSIFELLGENDPITRLYRQELASVLF